MERKEFVKLCSDILLQMGFRKNGTTHFYKDISDDTMIVVALCHSKYEAKYWFDGGFVIKPINKHLPFPKYYDANIRTMDISVDKQYYFDYLNIDNGILEKLKISMRTTLDFYSTCRNGYALMEKIIVPNSYELCKDYDIQKYLNYYFPPQKIIPDESQTNM